MTANFRRLIDSIHTKTFEEQKQTLELTLTNWQGLEKQTDDICVFGFSL